MTNQVPPLTGHDTADYAVFEETLRREGATAALDELHEVGRQAGSAARHRARRPGRGAPAGAAHPRPVRPPHRPGGVRPELPRADGDLDGLRPARHAVGVRRPARPPRACRQAERLGPGRRRPPVPDLDDVRRGAGAARRPDAGRAVRARAHRGRLRPVLPRAGGEAVPHRRHVDDGEAGRLGRAREHHPRRRIRPTAPTGSPGTSGSRRRRCPTSCSCSPRRRAGSPASSCRACCRTARPTASGCNDSRTSSATTPTPAARSSTSTPSAGGSATRVAACRRSSRWST